jgi:hypothetical protein
MENSRPQNPSIKSRPEGSVRRFRLGSSVGVRFVLALTLGFVATIHTGIAQTPEALPGPSLELELGPAVFFVKPDLLLVSFALRNQGTESVIIAQRPGVSLDATCLTEGGAPGIAMSAVTGVACGREEASFLELAPGETLLGKEVVNVPEKCVGEITVKGEFQTLTATAWDLPVHKASIISKPISISDR